MWKGSEICILILKQGCKTSLARLPWESEQFRSFLVFFLNWPYLTQAGWVVVMTISQPCIYIYIYIYYHAYLQPHLELHCQLGGQRHAYFIADSKAPDHTSQICRLIISCIFCMCLKDLFHVTHYIWLMFSILFIILFFLQILNTIVSYKQLAWNLGVREWVCMLDGVRTPIPVIWKIMVTLRTF